MDKELKENWLAALKSGHYIKGYGALRIDRGEYIEHCCLGVLAEVSDLGEWSEDSGNDGVGSYWIGDCSYRGFFGEPVDLEFSHQERLARINDQTATFDQVIEYIEKEI